MGRVTQATACRTRSKGMPRLMGIPPSIKKSYHRRSKDLVYLSFRMRCGFLFCFLLGIQHIFVFLIGEGCGEK